MDEDPREAILKHADAAVKEPFYIAPAYAETQPETIFHESDEEEEGKQRDCSKYIFHDVYQRWPLTDSALTMCVFSFKLLHEPPQGEGTDGAET